MPAELIEIEVVYAAQSQQQIIKCRVPVDSNVEQAIKLSGILQQFPSIDLTQQVVGIFSKRVELSSSLKKGDRIEIYRPLLLDPKQLRRLKAKR